MAFFNRLSAYGVKRESNLLRCNTHKTAYWLSELANGTSTDTFQQPENITGIRAKQPQVPLEIKEVDCWIKNWTFYFRIRVTNLRDAHCRTVLLEPQTQPSRNNGRRKAVIQDTVHEEKNRTATRIRDLHDLFRSNVLEHDDGIVSELAMAPEFDGWLDDRGEMTVSMEIGQREHVLRFPSPQMRYLVVVNA